MPFLFGFYHMLLFGFALAFVPVLVLLILFLARVGVAEKHLLLLLGRELFLEPLKFIQIGHIVLSISFHPLLETIELYATTSSFACLRLIVFAPFSAAMNLLIYFMYKMGGVLIGAV